jgi:hypothetical protein
MAVRVEVSYVSRRVGARSFCEHIQGLGGVWNGRPWYMSLRNLIWEIERPDHKRQWDFYVTIDGTKAWVNVASQDGRKYLTISGAPDALLKLPVRPPERVPDRSELGLRSDSE